MLFMKTQREQAAQAPAAFAQKPDGAPLTIDDAPRAGPEYRALLEKFADLQAKKERVFRAIQAHRAAEKSFAQQDGPDGMVTLILEGTVSGEPGEDMKPLEVLQEHFTALTEAIRRTGMEVGEARKACAREVAEIHRVGEYARLSEIVARTKLAARLAESERDAFLLAQDIMIELDLRGHLIDRLYHKAQRAEIDAELLALNRRAAS